MIRSGPKKSHTQVLIKKWEPELLKWEQSGLTQPEYCKRESLSLIQFYYWRIKLKKLKSSNKHQAYEPIIVKAGKIDLNSASKESNDCHMRLCFDEYCLELKNEFSSVSLSRLIKTLQAL